MKQKETRFPPLRTILKGTEASLTATTDIQNRQREIQIHENSRASVARSILPQKSSTLLSNNGTKNRHADQ
ncbi:MAG: hypothetical protein AAGB46_00290 [Verrucomicrobiota bacterium]